VLQADGSYRRQAPGQATPLAAQQMLLQELAGA